MIDMIFLYLNEFGFLEVRPMSPIGGVMPFPSLYYTDVKIIIFKNFVVKVLSTQCTPLTNS